MSDERKNIRWTVTLEDDQGPILIKPFPLHGGSVDMKVPMIVNADGTKSLIAGFHFTPIVHTIPPRP